MLLTKAELALANLAPKDESRWTLRAIAVEKEETVITNGHYLVSVKHDTSLADSTFPETAGLTHSTPNGKAVLIGRDAALSALKALPGRKSVPVTQNAALSADGKLFVNDLSNVNSFGTHAEGTFPNWRMVSNDNDKKTDKATVGLSASYLRALADYVEKYGKGESPVIKLTVYESHDAVKLEAETDAGQAIYALLMPVRL